MKVYLPKETYLKKLCEFTINRGNKLEHSVFRLVADTLDENVVTP
jgi:hypothetical protein